MANRLTIPGLKVPKLSGWPLVGILGVALAAAALVYGTATGNLDNSCTLRVNAANAPVRAEPNPTSTVLARQRVGDEVAVDKSQQTDGYWRLRGADGWISGNDATASAGSRC